MNPLAWLGLDDDADEAAVKRAYARRLRTTRPDEQPEAFQQLHTVYQQALALVRQRAYSEATVDDGGWAPEPEATAVDAPVDPEPAASPQASAAAATSDVAPAEAEPVSLSFDTFYRDLCELAGRGDGALTPWLLARPELWSFGLKEAVADALLRRLFDERPPLPRSEFAALLHFFALDGLQDRVDPLALEWLGRHLDLRWRLRHRPDKVFSKGDQRLGHRLLKPFAWAPVLALSLWPDLPSRMRRLVHTLGEGSLDGLPPEIDRRQAAFFDAAADRTRFAWPRLVVVAARLLAMALVITGIGWYTGAATAGSTFALVLTLWAAVMWAVFALRAAMYTWLDTEPAHGRWPALRPYALPAVALLALALEALTYPKGHGLWPVLFGLSLLWQRYGRQVAFQLVAVVMIAFSLPEAWWAQARISQLAAGAVLIGLLCALEAIKAWRLGLPLVRARLSAGTLKTMTVVFGALAFVGLMSAAAR